MPSTWRAPGSARISVLPRFRLSVFENYLCPADNNAAQAVYDAMVASNQPGDPSPA